MKNLWKTSSVQNLVKFCFKNFETMYGDIPEVDFSQDLQKLGQGIEQQSDSEILDGNQIGAIINFIKDKNNGKRMSPNEIFFDCIGPGGVKLSYVLINDLTEKDAPKKNGQPILGDYIIIFAEPGGYFVTKDLTGIIHSSVKLNKAEKSIKLTDKELLAIKSSEQRKLTKYLKLILEK